MERERIPKEWINRKVLVVLKNESRGTYAVLGRLREVTDEEFRLVMRSSGRLRNSFLKFMLYGIPVTFVSLVIATLYVLLRYYL